ncbi:MAG: hypothetical protein ACREJU_14390 [Nitrospiraceae bacterium]
MERSHGPAPHLLIFFTLHLAACASVQSPSATPAAHPSAAGSGTSTPSVTAESVEARAFRSMSREQEGRLAVCGQDRSCDRAHFTRALLYLSENQGLAAKHFQEVVALSPKSPLASLSVSWLRLLQNQQHQPEKRRDTVFAQTTQWLIHDLWSREQGLKEELSTRDRRLEALSAQLEALKQIDLEMDEKPHPLRPKPNQRTSQQN